MSKEAGLALLDELDAGPFKPLRRCSPISGGYSGGSTQLEQRRSLCGRQSEGSSRRICNELAVATNGSGSNQLEETRELYESGDLLPRGLLYDRMAERMVLTSARS